MEKKMSSLPKTDSITELAEFWDKHDITEFEDELEEVKEDVFVSGQDLTIHLPPSDAQALHQIATKRQVPESRLVSKWIHEHVQTE